MTWTKLWLDLFGTTLWGINMGFWVALAAVALIVIGMNVVFWSMKPLAKTLLPKRPRPISCNTQQGPDL